MRVFVLWAGLAIATVAPAAGADTNREQARDLAHEGMRLQDAGRHTEALQHFRHARSLVDAPTLAVLEARSLEALGRLREARQIYSEVRSRAAKPGEPRAFALAREQATERQAELDKRMPRIILEVEDSTNLDAVRVDGESVQLIDGRAQVQLDPGRHVITHQRGKQRTTRAIELLPYQVLAVDLESESPGATQRTLGWVGVGVGAAGVVTGVVFGMMAANADDDLERDCTSGRCPPGSHDDLDRFRTARTLSTVGYAGGVVGLGIGVALLTTAPSGPDRITKKGGVTVSATPNMAYVSGSF